MGKGHCEYLLSYLSIRYPNVYPENASSFLHVLPDVSASAFSSDYGVYLKTIHNTNALFLL
jgi:hypothetical protein